MDNLTLAGQQRLLTLAGRVFAALYGLGALLFTLTLLAVARYPIVAWFHYYGYGGSNHGPNPPLTEVLTGAHWDPDLLAAYPGARPLFVLALLLCGLAGLWLHGRSVRLAVRAPYLGHLSGRVQVRARWMKSVGWGLPLLCWTTAYLCWPQSLAANYDWNQSLPFGWFYQWHLVLPFALILLLGCGSFALCGKMVEAITLHQLMGIGKAGPAILPEPGHDVVDDQDTAGRDHDR